MRRKQEVVGVRIRSKRWKVCSIIILMGCSCKCINAENNKYASLINNVQFGITDVHLTPI